MGYPNTKEGAVALLAAVGGQPTRWRTGNQILTATAIGYGREYEWYCILAKTAAHKTCWTQSAWLRSRGFSDKYILPGTKDSGACEYFTILPECFLMEDPARYPHTCPTCKAPAYIGAIRHIACSSAACVHAERP